MNTQTLRYVLEVARTGSISKAADNLFISQPSLSKAIRELESALNITIFHRTSGGVTLTNKGSELMRHARGVLEQVDAMEALHLTGEDEARAFCLSAPHTAYIASAFAAFACAYAQPGAAVDMQYNEVGAAQAVRDVARERSHLGIVRCLTAYDRYFSRMIAQHRLDSQSVASYSLMALISREHPLAGKAVIAPADLRNLTELTQEDWGLPPRALSDAVGDARASRSGGIALTEWGTRLEVLRCMSDAYLLSPPTPRDVLDRFDLVQKPVDSPGLACRDVLITRPGYRFTPMDDAFVRALHDVAAEVMTGSAELGVRS